MDCVFVYILSGTFSFVINLLWIPGNPMTKERGTKKDKKNYFYQWFFVKDLLLALKTISKRKTNHRKNSLIFISLMVSSKIVWNLRNHRIRDTIYFWDHTVNVFYEMANLKIFYINIQKISLIFLNDCVFV